MAKLYNFKRLISKYSCRFTLTTYAEGTYVSGKYVDGAPTVSQRDGALVPMNESKVYQSGGAYTAKDMTLYMSSRINEPLKGAKVTHAGNTYSIEQETDHSNFADVYVYTLKWVSISD